MMVSRTSTFASAEAMMGRRMSFARQLLRSRPTAALNAMPPRIPSKLGITASDPMSALNKDLSRRRFAAPDANDQDRLFTPQASAAAIAGALVSGSEDGHSFSASGRTDIVAWVELECLSLQASMEDMLLSMGSGEYCSDLGNGMLY